MGQLGVVLTRHRHVTRLGHIDRMNSLWLSKYVRIQTYANPDNGNAQFADGSNLIRFRPLDPYGHIITITAGQQEHTARVADCRRRCSVRIAHGIALRAFFGVDESRGRKLRICCSRIGRIHVQDVAVVTTRHNFYMASPIKGAPEPASVTSTEAPSGCRNRTGFTTFRTDAGA